MTADPWMAGLGAANMFGVPNTMPNLALAAFGLGVPRGPPRTTRPQAKSLGRISKDKLPALSPEEVADRMALITAANQRNELKVRALIANPDFQGANQKDSDGRTALHVATLRKMPEDVCLEILKHPDFKDVNAVDRWGNTILTLAASNSHSKLCLAIIENEDFTAINIKDKWGATALHWAADRDLGDVCAAIMACPGFVEAHTVAFSFCFENRTALQRAEEKGCLAAADAIRKHLSLGWNRR